MTKDKFLYELIERCMLITCQDNILAENFALRDDNPYYEENEKQFHDCLKFYMEMNELLKRGEITETIMDQELYTVLALIRQRALHQMLCDLKLYLKQAEIKNAETEIEDLEEELQTQNINSEYLLSKIRDYRKLELKEKEGI